VAVLRSDRNNRKSIGIPDGEISPIYLGATTKTEMGVQGMYIYGMFDRDSVRSRGPMTNRKYVLGPGSDLRISPYMYVVCFTVLFVICFVPKVFRLVVVCRCDVFIYVLIDSCCSDCSCCSSKDDECESWWLAQENLNWKYKFLIHFLACIIQQRCK
jgi:hypothetical protein